jgi:hypothetical protein
VKIQSIQVEAINRAVSILRSIGAEFHIAHDGKQYGKAAPAAAPGRKPSPFLVLGIRDAVKQAKAGDVISHIVPLKATAVKLQSYMTAIAANTLGMGAAVSSIFKTGDGFRVDMLIVRGLGDKS